MSENPTLIEVTRGPAVESRHRGAFVVADSSGRIVASAGDIEMLVYPRSAAKPLQALPLVESGAADRFNLTNREIALACASHKGERAHIVTVENWLARVGLDVNALECGAHMPLTSEAARPLICGERKLTAAYNNCSGKHTGFLCTCVALGDKTSGYIDAEHPAQRRVTAALGEMTGCDLALFPMGRDGCGIPVFLIPLKNLALGMARMTDAIGVSPERAMAAKRVLDAMASEPFYVNGTDGFTTEVMEAAPRTVRAKGGAEGVYTAALPELGLGVAVKIDDGGMRGAECAVAHVLRSLHCFDANQERRLDRFLYPKVMTVAGREAGIIRPTELLQFAFTA